MPMLRTVTAILMASLVAPTLQAQGGRYEGRRREQDAALAATRSGQAMPLHQIEQRVVPRMAGADYLGPEFDPGSGTYRLKFMRGSSVIWVDVDGRTGRVVGRSGD
jgi:hypothetical protein